MFRADLEAARAAWIAEAAGDAAERARRQASSFLAYRDDNGRVVDFHSLRHSYITLLERSGAGVKLAQELARHSDIRLTMNVYTHAALHDLAAAVASLPNLLPAGPAGPRPALAAAGTDGARRPRPDQMDEVRCDSLTTIESGRADVAACGHAQQTLEMKPLQSDCERMITAETGEAPPGFEPGMADLQSAALPLG